MTEKSTGQMQNLHNDSSVTGGAASTVETPMVAAAVPGLTFSRGTRPLITRRAANGGLHDYRRRSV
jgi:hypothetical protein